MGNTKDPTGGMGGLSRKTKDRVDSELREDEIALLLRTQVDLESLRPHVSDEESFNKLVAVVTGVTGRNASLAELKERILALGEGTANVAKEIAGLVARAKT
jgi:hypothetical protein